MTINDIIAIGRQIAAETAEGGNTAARVGGVIEAIGEILKNQDYMSWQPAGNFDIEEYYEKNDQVFDAETNSCYVSLQTDNVGHPVDENDESYEEGWWMKVIDGASVLAAAAAATQAAAEANQAAEAARGIVYQAVDDHLDTESLKPVANQVVTQAINNLSENLQDVEESMEYTFSERSLYMLGEILRNALYVNDQSYNIEELLSTITDKGDYIKVPEGSQDGETLAVTLTSETGTSIYYTLDGSIPTKKDGIVYSAPFIPLEDCIVKAIAYGTGDLKSLMMSFTVKGSGIIVFKDANLEAVAKAATTADVVVTLPDSTTTTVKGLGWDKDHDGVITLDDMRQVTSLRSFNSQKWVQYLDVLKYTRFTSMDNYQFFGCSNLKELNIPGTCKTTKGITQCTSLQKLVFEEGVTTVGAINGCTITSMKLPDSLTSFGGITGCGTSLRASGGLVIPKNVTAFPNVYNTKVGRIKHLGNITTIPMNNLSYAGNTEVYLASNVVPTKTGTASQGAITKLYVPDEMIPLYAESADWASLYSSGKIVSINNWVD